MDITTRVGDLLRSAGTTYAGQAGIRMADRPMPLFQLLVLSMLSAKPIDADSLVAAVASLGKLSASPASAN